MFGGATFDLVRLQVYDYSNFWNIDKYKRKDCSQHLTLVSAEETPSKIILKDSAFCQKVQILCSLEHTKHIYVKKCMERLQTSNVSTSNGSKVKLWTENLLQKLIFDQAFYVTIANSELKAKVSPFDKHLDHMLVKFEQNLSLLTNTGSPCVTNIDAISNKFL